MTAGYEATAQAYSFIHSLSFFRTIRICGNTMASVDTTLTGLTPRCIELSSACSSVTRYKRTNGCTNVHAEIPFLEHGTFEFMIAVRAQSGNSCTELRIGVCCDGKESVRQLSSYCSYEYYCYTS